MKFDETICFFPPSKLLIGSCTITVEHRGREGWLRSYRGAVPFALLAVTLDRMKKNIKPGQWLTNENRLHRMRPVQFFLRKFVNDARRYGVLHIKWPGQGGLAHKRTGFYLSGGAIF